MKTSLIIPVAVATVAFTGAGVFAASTGTTTTSSSPSSTQQITPPRDTKHISGVREGTHHIKGRMHEMKNLTDAEKTALKTMTDTQKKEFFEKKRAEMEAKMTAENTVIDKLLAGQTLTAEEEALRKTIITERAQRKTEMETRKAEMEKIKTILDKKKTGTPLTAEETTLLESMPMRWQWRMKNTSITTANTKSVPGAPTTTSPTVTP